MLRALVDTSFLISLTSSTRKNHAVAQAYYKHAINSGVRLYLSTVAVAEFCRKQPLADLPLKNFLILPFNLDDATKAAALCEHLSRPSPDARACIVADFKLIAQAATINCSVILTEDEKTMHQYCERLRHDGKISCFSIVLEHGFNPDSFDNPGAPRLSIPLAGNTAPS